MHGNSGNQNKSGRIVRGGATIDMSKVDPNKVDDFRERIKREEEERKQNQSSGQSSSRRHN